MRHGFWILPLLLLPLAGCEDDPVVIPSEIAFTVRVVDRDSGLPQDGVKVVVMDPAANRPVSGPVETDETGRLEFVGLDPGTYVLLTFPGDERGVFSHPGEFQLGGDDVLRKTPPALDLEIVTWRDPVRFADRLPRISGTVVDAVTGDPLPGAFVGFPSTADLYLGHYTVSVDVTDSAGAFHVADIPVAQDPISGNLTQAAALTIQCAGYEPLAWRNHFDNGDDNVDVIDAVAELWPIGSTRPVGSVAGRVIFGEAPVADIEVGLAYFDDPDNPFLDPDGAGKSGVGAPGLVTRTDAQGRYLLESVPAGRYLLLPAYHLSDHWLPSPYGNPEVTVIADSTVTLDPAPVLAAITPLWPRPGCAVREAKPTWRWVSPVAVDSFLVYLDRCFLGATVDSKMTMPDACPLTGGLSRFGVRGLLDGVIVAETEALIEFQVDLPED